MPKKNVYHGSEREKMTINAPMNIGEWLLNMRRKRKFDLRDLAAQTGLDIGTISKIENGRTQATLGTFVRAGKGLGVTANDFIQNWQGKPFSLPNESQVIEEATIPTLQDIEALVTWARVDKQPISIWIAKALNSVSSLQGEAVPLFEPEVVEKLLFGPLWLRHEVQYPPEMLTEEILDILRLHGVMIPNDISAYFAKIESKKQITTERTTTLLKVFLKEGSLLEIGSAERFKMPDVLLLDQELKQNGKIIAMLWNVCLFHIEMLRLQAHISDQTGTQGAISAKQEVRLALMFINVCRWLQHINKNDTSWIHDLRMKLRQLNLLNTSR